METYTHFMLLENVVLAKDQPLAFFSSVLQHNKIEHSLHEL